MEIPWNCADLRDVAAGIEPITVQLLFPSITNADPKLQQLPEQPQHVQVHLLMHELKAPLILINQYSLRSSKQLLTPDSFVSEHSFMSLTRLSTVNDAISREAARQRGAFVECISAQLLDLSTQCRCVSATQFTVEIANFMLWRSLQQFTVIVECLSIWFITIRIGLANERGARQIEIIVMITNKTDKMLLER